MYSFAVLFYHFKSAFGMEFCGGDSDLTMSPLLAV
jgi:hypothetical protein